MIFPLWCETWLLPNKFIAILLLVAVLLITSILISQRHPYGQTTYTYTLHMFTLLPQELLKCPQKPACESANKNYPLLGMLDLFSLPILVEQREQMPISVWDK